MTCKNILVSVCAFAFTICLVPAINSFADDVTPMDAPLPPGKITTITCQCTDEMAKKYKFFTPVKVGTYHYKVYIPEGYDKDTDRKYPAFFFFSPGGNSGMYSLDEKIKKDKWLGLMMVEAKNGPFEDIFGNTVAAWEDACKRLRVFEGMTCATGFSGGARMSGACVTTLPTGAGMICQGAGPSPGGPTFPGKEAVLKRKIAICMFVGQNDSNLKEIDEMKTILGSGYPYFYSETFDGKHENSPKELMLKGYDWLVEQMCSTAEPGKILKSFFLDYIKNKVDLAGQSTSIIDKYETFNSVSALITKQKLDKETDFKDIVDNAKAKMEEIKKDPAYKKESAAKEAYLKVESYEKDIRKTVAEKKATGNDLKNALNLVINSYRTVAKAHKDTAYGQKAEAKAADIEKERG